MADRTTLGVIVGNRGFFPDHLASEGRQTILKVLEQRGFDVVALTPEDTAYGSVETWKDAQVCADLFKRNADKIDGILVSLPNFGDERGVADTLRLAGLDVPVLVQAFSDDSSKMTIKTRRDSFCGKMSVCNNLSQYGIKYSLTARHTVNPESDDFARDLHDFAACCRVVGGLKGARIGAIGARPDAFNTVRYSEKLLEGSGISVITVDLFEIFGRIEAMADNDPLAVEKLAKIHAYVPTKGVPDVALLKMAKLGAVIDVWMDENGLTATAIQCWTALQKYFGVVPCTVMSMLSNSLLPSACEVDIAGTVAMQAMALASQKLSALLDRNNGFDDDPDLCMMFHCANLPKDVFVDPKMDYQEIIAGSVGKENTYGTVVGRMKPGAFSYLRVSTDDAYGTIRGYIGEGTIKDKALDTFGGYGVARIPRLQDLLQYICREGFEHHVAMTAAQVSGGVNEALSNYLEWDMYMHAPEVS